MHDSKTLLGILGSLIGLMSYVPYFRDIFRGKTKPHAFSWFVWGLVSAIAFSAQTLSDGGIGAWATGVTAIAGLSIAGISIFKGEKDITRLDVISFFLAVLGLFVWRETSNPLSAVLIVILVYAFGFIPTFRKAYLRPFQETLLTFILSLFKWGFGLLALSVFSPTTVLFPAAVFMMNTTFCGMLIVRRRKLSAA